MTLAALPRSAGTYRRRFRSHSGLPISIAAFTPIICVTWRSAWSEGAQSVGRRPRNDRPHEASIRVRRHRCRLRNLRRSQLPLGRRGSVRGLRLPLPYATIRILMIGRGRGEAGAEPVDWAKAGEGAVGSAGRRTMTWRAVAPRARSSSCRWSGLAGLEPGLDRRIGDTTGRLRRQLAPGSPTTHALLLVGVER